MPALRRAAREKGLFPAMKIPHKVRPWLFLWVPWGAVVLCAVLGVFYGLKPTGAPPPRLMTREPLGDLGFLHARLSPRQVPQPAWAAAFLGPVKPEPGTAAMEEPQGQVRQGVTVSVSGVLIGGRVRYGVINGVPYTEGSMVPEAGLVERVQKQGVTIVAEDGRRIFVGVGKRVAL